MSRPPGTLQRLERILTMVPWLLENPGATVDEVTARFGVSQEALASDLDVLGYCGLPGYGGGDLVEASIVGDRVVVRMADFFRRPLRLSLREAVTLMLAAGALSDVGTMPESAALRTAQSKLADLLGASMTQERRGRAAVTETPRIAVDLAAPGDEHLPALRTAIADGHVVRITYRSASKAVVTRRDVEPWALVGWRGSWYLQGYCRRVQAPRDFRLDRIRELEAIDEPVADRERPPMPDVPAYQPSPGDERVVLDLAPDAWWVAEWAVVEDVVDSGDIRRVTLRAPQLEWVARLVLALGEDARVVEPSALTESVAALAGRTLARYEDS